MNEHPDGKCEEGFCFMLFEQLINIYQPILQMVAEASTEKEKKKKKKTK